jgi:hypothetical protein
MSPMCSRVALRVLVPVLFACSIANAAALPHEVLDARDPMDHALANQAIQAAQAASSDVPENVFEEISEDMNEKSGYEWFMDFFSRLFAARPEDEDPETVTVYVTPTPTMEATSSAFDATTTSTPANATSSMSMVPPPGPESTTMSPTSDAVSSAISSTTLIKPNDFSILPVGDMSSAINATFLTPIFSTAPETTAVASSSAVIMPPYPANSISNGPLPTAVSITGQFSVNPPLSTGAYLSAPPMASVSAGLPLPWGGNWTYPAINPTLILTNPIASSNATASANITVGLTSTTVVLETVYPTPIMVTGPPVSAGTGSPIAVSESYKWVNTTCTTTIISGIATVLPIYPGTASGLPISVGTAPISAGTGLPVPSYAEAPLYPNTTLSAAPVYVTQLPISVTGVPGSVVEVSVSIPAAPYANSTLSAPPMIMSTGAPTVSDAALPISTSEPSYFNTTTTEGVPESTGAAVETGAPVLSFSETPLYPNATTVTATATAPVILPASDVPAFPGTLNVTIVVDGGYADEK